MKTFRHFNLGEFFAHCSTEEILNAIRNKSVINNIVALDIILENLRGMIDSPILVNSAYRDKAHNERAGGSDTSQHLNGSAADIACRDGLLPLLAEYVINSGRVQNDFTDEELTIPRIGQVIVYLNQYSHIRFIHIALANDKHPCFELWEHNGSLRQLTTDSDINFLINILHENK